MTMLSDGGFCYDRRELEARPWLGEGGDAMKILHIDEQMGQVIFIQRFGQGSVHPRHTHHCTAIAYTLSGCWQYGDDQFPQGAVGFEPFGTTHAAEAPPDQAAEVLVILTAGPARQRLLELHYEDGRSVELDLAFFKRLQAMTSNDEWRALAAEVAQTS